MFKVTPNGPNRIDIEFSGKLDETQMQVALDELISKSADVQQGRMLYRIGDFKLPTLGALKVELLYMPKLISLIRKFDRAAVLADQSWIKVISEIEGAVIPGLTIKAFNVNDEAGAEAWLQG